MGKDGNLAVAVTGGLEEVAGAARVFRRSHSRFVEFSAVLPSLRVRVPNDLHVGPVLAGIDDVRAVLTSVSDQMSL